MLILSDSLSLVVSDSLSQSRHSVWGVQHVEDLLELWQLAPWTGYGAELLVNYQDTIDSSPFFLAALLIFTLWVTFG